MLSEDFQDGFELEDVTFICRIWYSISETVSDGNPADDCSIRAFAAKPRAFGAPLCGFGA
jgi:hypothetical protein